MESMGGRKRVVIFNKLVLSVQNTKKAALAAFFILKFNKPFSLPLRLYKEQKNSIQLQSINVMKLSLVKPICAFCGSLLMCALFLFSQPKCDKEAKVIIKQEKLHKVDPLELVSLISVIKKA